METIELIELIEGELYEYDDGLNNMLAICIGKNHPNNITKAHIHQNQDKYWFIVISQNIKKNYNTWRLPYFCLSEDNESMKHLTHYKS